MTDLFDDDCPDFDLPAPTPAKVLPPRRKPRPDPVVEDSQALPQWDAPKPDPDLLPGVMPKGKGWKVNDGKAPRYKAGRAIVKLRNGSVCGTEPVTKESKLGWDIGSTRWTLTGSPFDIEFHRPI